MTPEDRIRKAFERVDPPEGFAERVLARVRREEPREIRQHPSRWVQRAAAAGLMMLIGLGGLAGWRFEQQRKAEAAAEQAVMALRIVSEKVNIAKETVSDRYAQ